MSEHDADAVVERIDALMWTEPHRKASKRERAKMVLAALKPGDRLPGGLVVVPEEPTWEMEQASITAPMPPYDKSATKKKRHENLVAKIHSRWNAMLVAAAITEPRGQHADEH